MRLGVLETGKVDEALALRHDQYPDMFARLFRKVDPTIEVQSYAVVNGEFPASVRECDAWLLTGSRHGVYDDLPWIGELKGFLRRARTAGVPIIGICFGHQIMAEAFGGRAEKSSKGWGLGVQEYEVLPDAPEWMAGAPGRIALQVVHQDQVTAIPSDASCLATSPFCEYAMLAYGNREMPDAISIQAHPEFDASFVRDLIERAKGMRFPEAEANAGLASLQQDVQGTEFARWSLAWLKHALAGQSEPEPIG